MKLPDPVAWFDSQEGKFEWAQPMQFDVPVIVAVPKIPIYSAAQLAETRRQALEEAAKMVEGLDPYGPADIFGCVFAIRALIEEKE